ncbi:MAG: hypothetical protein RL277_1129 [Planctomycetota bacterium]|jgi:formiminotetrahydrofolate cyclodeaminase
MTENRFAELSLTRFEERIAERTATPGGGSVAAHAGGLGAALCAMALRFTSGERYAAVQTSAARHASELDRLRARLSPLIDADSQAYDRVSAARKLPKNTDDEKAARTQAVQHALKGALEVPLETMGCALQALELMAPLASVINPNLASDCVSGSWCLRTAVESAYLNVRINALDITDRAFVDEKLAEADRRLARSRQLCEEIRAAAEKLMQ